MNSFRDFVDDMKPEVKKIIEKRKAAEKNGNRTVVTSENREEFMKKKLGLDKEDSQDMPSTKYVVKYHNSKGEQDSGEKHFDDEEKAMQHAEKGNKTDKVGGKYSVHKIRIK